MRLIRISKWVKEGNSWEYLRDSELDVAFDDYEIIFDSYLESFVEEYKSSLLKEIHNKYSNLPFTDFVVLAVDPGSLDSDVARYLNGTYSEPRIVVDMEKHGTSNSELMHSILHELSPAVQESRGEDMCEEDAERF